ncbi:hypothetical protein PHMEG_00012223 [Phytophthora megakarya]|uniref:Uncharacterized protein n=1 Tax=Phytophthora megakarya TaxID=4795 RepID=A0A225W9R3_9STRA|nr:hypothetical protein PHMEG_00012223 [Phytophthora megakarya]
MRLGSRVLGGTSCFKNRFCGNQAVCILLDSGTDHNVIHKGLSSNILRRKRDVAEHFDGTSLRHSG